VHYPTILRLPLLRQLLAGALGGFVVALLLEPSYLSSGWTPGTLFGGSDNAFVPGVLFTGLVTAFLVTADDPWAGNLERWVKRTVGIAGMAVVLGWGYSIIAHGVFGILAGTGTYGDLSARGAGWSVFGLGVGLCAGLASRSLRRAYQGCAGGLAGGFLGGAAFSFILSLGGNGTLNRFAGFTLLGAAVGLATALAEHLTRTAWVTFLSSTREGRQVVLYREENRLGRDELAEIPLFGETGIDPTHAILTLSPRPLIREIGVKSLLRVNGTATREAALTDGDVFEIGSYRFRFQMKVSDALPHLFGSGAEAEPVLQNESARPPTAFGMRPAEMGESMVPQAVPLPEGGLILRVMAGGAQGRHLRLSGMSCTVGRESDNTLPLPDPKVSRYHAQIINIDGAWIMTDLGSTNGTRMNGIHITRGGLAPGDFLYFGDTAVAVESAAPVRARDAASAIQANR
jgi:hypothetical protein